MIERCFRYNIVTNHGQAVRSFDCEGKSEEAFFVKALINWEKYGIEKGRKIEANTSLQAAVSDTSRKRNSFFFFFQIK